jgi:uncharacterized LabA/DUF88 family protein
MNPTNDKFRRVFFYVDGFNLYYRRLENDSANKWLNVRKLAERLTAQIGTIEQIKYFTAKVDSDSDAPSPKQKRQMLYWDALRSVGVEIIEGHIESKRRPCRDRACGKIIPLRSEKMSDVNLALHVYRDYLESSPDVIFVLSGDCDLIPSLKMVQECGSKPGFRKAMRIVCLPVEEDGMLFSRLPLHYQVARTVKLGQSDIRLSQFDEEIVSAGGKKLSRPDTWR